MATTVTYTVTTSDRGTADVDCSVCGPLVDAAPQTSLTASALRSHAGLHLAQAGRFGRLMTRDDTAAALAGAS